MLLRQGSSESGQTHCMMVVSLPSARTAGLGVVCVMLLVPLWEDISQMVSMTMSVSVMGDRSGLAGAGNNAIGLSAAGIRVQVRDCIRTC